jgi:hypothetical protein
VTPATKKNYHCIPGKAETWADEEDFDWLVFAEDADISGEDMKAIVEMATQTFVPGKPFLVVADLRRIGNLSDEARKFGASTAASQFYAALAIIASSPATNLVANFFIRFHKPPAPTRVFSSEEAALKWLRKFKQS